MAFDEKTYHDIQRYLDRQLGPEERQAFERQMQADPELAREVELNREMQEFLADTPENELRKNLRMLSDQTPEPKKRRPGGKWWWLLVPCLVLGGWWVVSRQPEKPRTEELTAPVQEIPDEEETAPPKAAEETEKPPVRDPQKSREPGQPGKGSEKPADKGPVAANFDPLPALEFLIGNNLRDADFQWNITDRPKDAALPSPGAAFNFRFAGTVASETNLIKKTFNLHIFSNAPAAYEAFRPLFSYPLPFQPGSENVYPFDFQKQLTLRPGLYYYLIEDTATEKIYWADKFAVR